MKYAKAIKIITSTLPQLWFTVFSKKWKIQIKAVWFQLAIVVKLRKSRNLTWGWENNYIFYCVLVFLVLSAFEKVHKDIASKTSPFKSIGLKLCAKQPFLKACRYVHCTLPAKKRNLFSSKDYFDRFFASKTLKLC